jgi:hypothetical protein
MTDPELTPAQERAVRDRLADARHTGPVPDDVVARLDDTLRQLAAEGTELPALAPVVTLASRRRRTAAAVLVAAAAVVVAGVGIGQVLPTGGEDAATSGAGVAADREFGAAPEAEQDSGAAGPTDSRRTAGAKTDAPGAAVAGLPTAALSRDELRRDLRLLVDLADTAYERSSTCDAGDVGAGRLLPVTYDGQEALVVLRTPRAGFRQADVYLCGDDSLVRSVELPAR